MSQEMAIKIRTKKLGVLLRDARMAAGKSMKDCGESIGVSGGMISSYERGNRAPSLPELEMLSFFLDIPIEHFWSDEIKSEEQPPTEALNAERLMALRQRIIGAMLRSKREEANLTQKELAAETGITISRIRRYEAGETPVPVPELEALGRTLNYPVRQFTIHSGPVGDWISEQRAIQEFLEMPPELQDFVTKPINRPYVELAQRLSEMSVDKLREVAEGLLEITL